MANPGLQVQRLGPVHSPPAPQPPAQKKPHFPVTGSLLNLQHFSLIAFVTSCVLLYFGITHPGLHVHTPGAVQFPCPHPPEQLGMQKVGLEGLLGINPALQEHSPFVVQTPL